MTTKAQWLALADRCETATGSDQEIDAAICITANYAGPNSCGATNIRVDPEFNHGDLCYLCFAIDGVDDCCNPIPDLTGSLDAITALIERELPGWFYGSWRGTMRKSHGTFWAEVYFMNGSTEKWLLVDVFGDPIMSPGATEALARCAAFCRAMSEKAP